MKITKVEEKIYLIDVQPGKISNFIGSYILKGEKSVIIETGPTSSISNLLASLNELKIEPSRIAYVAVSHIHLDHGGGAGTILKFLPNAEIIVHRRGVKHLTNPKKLWEQSLKFLGKTAEIYGKPEAIPDDRIKPVENGTILELGDEISIEIIDTPGHSSHHQSFFYPKIKGIFPGDAAGIYLKETKSILPTTPTPFHLEFTLSSLDKLIELNPKVIFFSHFGKATFALEKLRMYKNQIEFWMENVKQGIKEQKSMREISKNIIMEDKNINQSWNYINSKPFLKEVFSESLEGFINYELKES
jgi:glyoxylase-like metal-dependent hydrolase (beta-lactamase superfamily II)